MSFDFIQKKITPSTAFKDKKCDWCTSIWSAGDKIFTVSDLITDKFFLLCHSCGPMFQVLRAKSMAEYEKSAEAKTDSTTSVVDLKHDDNFLFELEHKLITSIKEVIQEAAERLK